MMLPLPLVVLLFVCVVAADVSRPRGVSLTRTSLYRPGANGEWTCLDGLKTIRFTQVNDDYCDCADSSDEPGTSACSSGRFHCANVGHRPLVIPSSRVNDGICDCCDASDEYVGNVGQCHDTCQALGHAEQEKRKVEAELYKRGSNKRAEMIAKGKQMRAERATRRGELERRRVEQEAIKTEREALKRAAEAAEAEALEMYKEQQRENDGPQGDGSNAPAEDGAQTMRLEAEASFARYDVNKDGFVEVTELQVDMTLDQDRNGVVTVEEAKYFLDERDRIDLEAYVLLSWPRIKPMQMLSQGLFKPPKVDGEHDHDHAQPAEPHTTVHPNEAHDQATQHVDHSEGNGHHDASLPHADDGDADEEEVYEEDDGDEDDVGEGSVQEVEPQPTPEYDPETQHLIDLANEARNAYADIERELNDIDHEIKDIDEHDTKDYGPNDEYASLDGECFKFEDREYVYSLCPFDRASQKPRSGGSETTLGRWDQWMDGGDEVRRYDKQRYAHGASCWNGPQRSAIVALRCALEDKIVSVSEPNRCEYFFEFETAAACDATQTAADDVERMHDEL